MMPSHISASQIESFDPKSSPFACKRRWWFERIGRRVFESPVPPMGVAAHDTLERFLKGADQGVLHDVIIKAPGALEYLMKLRKRVKLIEYEIESGQYKIAGVPAVGFIDWVANGPLEVGDHKTTSVINRYAKSVGQVKGSTQLNIYAHALHKVHQFDISDLLLTMDYYQTKGANKFKVVTAETTGREVAQKIEEIEAVVEDMVRVSKVADPNDVEPNEDACYVGKGCPHQAYCKRSGALNMASLMDEFFPPLKIEPKVEPPPQQVLAPDAPKSNPPPLAQAPAAVVESVKAIATAMEAARVRKDGKPGLEIEDKPTPASEPQTEPQPVPVTPVVEAEPPKRKRGRPPGSPNKPPETPEVKEIVAVVVDRISIRHEVKLGKPNYSSAGVSAGMEGTVPPGGSLADAKAALSLQVRELLMSELKVYDKRLPAAAVNDEKAPPS